MEQGVAAYAEIITSWALCYPPAMFAFFHVGDDCRLPVRLVQSIRQFHPDAPVYMVTDADTPTLKGVIRHEVEVNPETLMLSRTLGYADLGLTDPTLYLDTDMALNRPISPRSALGDASAGFCRRSYHRDAPFNGFQRDGAYSDLHLEPLDRIFPYVGCTVIAVGWVWAALAARHLALEPRFHAWYGDQIALREFAAHHPVVDLPESEWAGLPDLATDPAIWHWKGLRKRLILPEG
jgi:hypothetical protein